MKRRTERLAKVLTVSVFIVLLVYVTLDAIYFHVFFSSESESAVVVPLVQMLIVMGAMVILLFIQQRERKGNLTEGLRAVGWFKAGISIFVIGGG